MEEGIVFRTQERVTLQRGHLTSAVTLGKEIQPTLGNFVGTDQKSKLTAFLLLPSLLMLSYWPNPSESPRTGGLLMQCIQTSLLGAQNKGRVNLG